MVQQPEPTVAAAAVDASRPMRRLRRSRHLRIVAIALASALVAAGCGGDDGGGGGKGPAAANDTLVVAVPSLGAQNWTPWLASGDEDVVTSMVGETLTRIDPETHDIVPGIATEWSLSPDLKTWTFKIRDDVPFQGGYGNVTADDVKFSWSMWIRDDSEQRQAAFYRQAVDGNMDNFTIVSPTEFTLHTDSTPVTYLDAAVSNAVPGMPIQSKAYFEKEPDKALTNPLGTGPWEFVSSKPGVEVKLKAVADHYRQPPAYKFLTFRIIEDDAARLSALRTGEADIAPLVPSLVGEAESAKVNVQEIPDVESAYVAFGGNYFDDPENYDRDSPWIQADDPEKGLAIRTAMSMAIDRASILDKLLLGQGTLVHAPAFEFPSNPNLTDPSWELPEFDLDHAKELLAEGGYPDGFKVKIPVYDDFTASRDIQEAIAGMWEDLGLEVEREETTFDDGLFPRLTSRTTAGYSWVNTKNFAAVPVQAVGNADMPDTTVQSYHLQAYYDAYAQMVAEPDQAKRDELMRGLMTTLIDQKPIVPLFTLNLPVGLSPNIGSWDPLPGIGRVTNLETVQPK
jgi:peptide/nickel transport system substrate-binding protein